MSNRDTIITALKKATVAIGSAVWHGQCLCAGAGRQGGARGELGGCSVIIGNAALTERGD